MHNIDHTLLETDESTAFPYSDEANFEGGLSPAEELGLASELLEVNDEEELEEFLGKVLNKAAGAARRFASSPRGQAVGGYLRSALKEALPGIGRAVGERVRPGGGEAGARIASAAGDMLGLELEGLSPEDKEFEASRQLVRLACAAAHRASRAPRNADPDEAAREAVEAALRQFAPGLAARASGDLVAADRALDPLSEEEEEDLAAEMLEVSSEEDLDRFLGKVIKAAHKPAGPKPVARKPGASRPARGTAGAAAFLRSPAAQALGGVLKQVAKTALPMVGGAIGTALLPGIGGAIGSDLGGALSNLFEVDPESMQQEEAELEAARRFVGLSAAATQHLAGNPHAGASPKAAAWQAVLDASKEYAPGLHRQLLGQPGNGHPRHHQHHRHHRHHRHEPWLGGDVEFPTIVGEPVVAVPDDGEWAMTGTWERRGNRIILHGA